MAINKCRVCKNEYQDDFYSNSTKRSMGRICKECHNKKQRDFRKKTKFKVNSYIKKYRDKHREKHSARKKVDRAIKEGRLQRQPCEVCGDEITQAHHEDYYKPLEVKWLCVLHHSKVKRQEKQKYSLKKDWVLKIEMHLGYKIVETDEQLKAFNKAMVCILLSEQKKWSDKLNGGKEWD